MGLPEQNENGYRIGSPINFAEGLKGKLLIVHGSGDDNVHYQGTERLVNRLVELGKPFDLMIGWFRDAKNVNCGNAPNCSGRSMVCLGYTSKRSRRLTKAASLHWRIVTPVSAQGRSDCQCR